MTRVKSPCQSFSPLFGAVQFMIFSKPLGKLMIMRCWYYTHLCMYRDDKVQD